MGVDGFRGSGLLVGGGELRKLLLDLGVDRIDERAVGTHEDRARLDVVLRLRGADHVTCMSAGAASFQELGN